MKYILVTLIVLCTLFSYGQSATCQDYRDGEFKMVYEDRPTIFITRKGNVQIERVDGERKTMKLAVTWIDDCTYTLEDKGFKLIRTKKDFPKGAILTVKIIRTTSTFYKVRVSTNFTALVVESKIYRLKPED